MAEPSRILIVRPSALGDVCRTVPILATLRRAYPRATIDWVVQSEFAAAIASHPALDEAICFPRKDFGRWWRKPAVALALRRWLSDLRRRRYDLVIDGQGLGRSGLITWATRAPRRVGLRSARELGWLGYTVRHRPPAAPHTVDRMMSILIGEGLEPVYDMRLYAAEEDRTWWRRQRDELEMQDGAYFVLAPTSRWPSKRWPQADWAELIGPLGQRGFNQGILIGGPSERDQVDQIARVASAGRIVDLVGRTSLGQTMAIVADAGLVIANDSAPLHMAIGFSRPCIGLFGPTDPARVGPYGAEDAVVRAEAPAGGGEINFKDPALGDSLMRRIRPPAVLARVDRVLAAGATGRRSQSGPAPAVVEVCA